MRAGLAFRLVTASTLRAITFPSSSISRPWSSTRSRCAGRGRPTGCGMGGLSWPDKAAAWLAAACLMELVCVGGGAPVLGATGAAEEAAGSLPCKASAEVRKALRRRGGSAGRLEGGNNIREGEREREWRKGDLSGFGAGTGQLCLRSPSYFWCHGQSSSCGSTFTKQLGSLDKHESTKI